MQRLPRAKGAEQLGRVGGSRPKRRGLDIKLARRLADTERLEEALVFGALQAGLTANGLSGSHEPNGWPSGEEWLRQ